MEDNSRKLIIVSLGSLLLGSLFFIFGQSISSSNIPLLVYYVIAIILYDCSIIALYNNYKKDKKSVYLYIMILSVFLIIIVSFATISRII